MNIVIVSSLPLFFFSCVSSKKFKTLDASYKKMREDNKKCDDQLKSAQSPKPMQSK